MAENEKGGRGFINGREIPVGKQVVVGFTEDDKPVSGRVVGAMHGEGKTNLILTVGEGTKDISFDELEKLEEVASCARSEDGEKLPRLTSIELAEFDASSKRLEDVRSGWMVAQKLKKRGITGEIGEEKEIILDGKKTTIKITPDLAEILPKEGLPCLTERELSILGSASVADAEVVEICKKHGLQMMEDRDAPGVERDIYVLFGNSDYKKIKIGLWKGDLGVEISS